MQKYLSSVLEKCAVYEHHICSVRRVAQNDHFFFTPWIAFSESTKYSLDSEPCAIYTDRSHNPLSLTKYNKYNGSCKNFKGGVVGS